MQLKTLFGVLLVVFCTSNLLTFYLHSRAALKDKEGPAGKFFFWFFL